jgi:hypothetical protein
MLVSEAWGQYPSLMVDESVDIWYEIQRNLSLQVTRDFILEYLTQKLGLTAQSQFSDNA